ncbi:RNA polymerase sigma factor SigJ [Gottfriedia solisilvae]|uniref:RNA polymerase sigma factor SigJ n=1 Tax=Gottfriedia solisilvae TaxID=1516104 RepID=A0A8J3AM68_9BACI|nr:RNA polymerase sigma factor SigJ [Gottfriedia solisilvae]GGI16283.1 RNA polymerase sigma factor SigJ [Gottfriedia solisilvae]
MDIDILYSEYKPLLFSIGYHMLGSVEDSEDLVQDTFVAIHQLSKTSNEEPNNIKAFLCKVMTNRCLDLLKSTRKKREVYVGPWLPEPILQLKLEGTHEDPAEKVILDETISYALLVLLEQLTPVERAVFLLREVFEFDYKNIADILSKTEMNCRKIFSRIKEKIQADHQNTKPNIREDFLLAKRFIEAVGTGNLEVLISLLTDDIVLISDGGGKVKAALRPLSNKNHVIAFLTGVAKKEANSAEVKLVMVNGQIGILVDGKDPTIICFEKAGDCYKRIYLVRNPDKIRIK